jgi:hypothetical protein
MRGQKRVQAGMEHRGRERGRVRTRNTFNERNGTGWERARRGGVGRLCVCVCARARLRVLVCVRARARARACIGLGGLHEGGWGGVVVYARVVRIGQAEAAAPTAEQPNPSSAAAKALRDPLCTSPRERYAENGCRWALATPRTQRVGDYPTDSGGSEHLRKDTAVPFSDFAMMHSLPASRTLVLLNASRQAGQNRTAHVRSRGRRRTPTEYAFGDASALLLCHLPIERIPAPKAERGRSARVRVHRGTTAKPHSPHSAWVRMRAQVGAPSVVGSELMTLLARVCVGQVDPILVPLARAVLLLGRDLPQGHRHRPPAASPRMVRGRQCASYRRHG